MCMFLLFQVLGGRRWVAVCVMFYFLKWNGEVGVCLWYINVCLIGFVNSSL